MSSWPCLQILVVKQKFEIVFEIVGAKLPKSASEAFSAAEQGFKLFGDVSGCFLNFSFHFSFWN